MLNVQALVDKRDKLNADLATLISTGTVTQTAVDNIAAELETIDNDVLAAIGPPPALNFSAFDAAVAAFKARVTKQISVDNLTTTVANTN